MRTKKEGIVLVVLFAALFLSTMAWAVDCPLPDTGQTKCYDAYGVYIIPCPSSGEAFYGQDAQYPCNPQSYTMLTGGIMVRDNVTGLIWENKTNDDSIHDKDNEYDWYDAQDVFIATLNNDNFGGYSDWRLPTVKELSFIRNIDVYDPTINTNYFPNTVSGVGADYWSSTSYVSYVFPNYAWGVNFSDGTMYFGGRSGYNYVRAVRGGQCGSFGNFIDNGNGTVTDTDTGLMWEQDTTPGSYTWEEVLSYCENLTLAGYNDWRLPNINELQSLVDYSTGSPAIDTTYFPDTESQTGILYCSSTSFVLNPPGLTLGVAWGVNFSDGFMYGCSKLGLNYVRAVRDGQCGSFDPSTTTTAAGSTTTTAGTNTTTTANGGSCTSEVIYGEHSAETELLRHFRDNVLCATPEGQEIIRLYYQWSPMIVNAMEGDEEFKKDIEGMIDGVLVLIEGETE